MTKPIPPLDLMWLLIESPANTTHVGAMMLFKKPPGRRAMVREVVETYRGLQPTPPFNYVPELGAGAPQFREVTDWNPRYHVQYLALPAGSSYEDLLSLITDLHEPMLDRDRPLFRCWVIDGVPGGRFAIYTKVHHAIIDGVSGLKKLYAGLSTTDEHTIPAPAFALPPEPRPPRQAGTPLLRRFTGSVRGAVSQVGAINQISVTAARKALAAAMRTHLKGSLPFLAHHAPTNEPLRIARGFATLTLPLDEMHEIGRQFGATLNDVAATIVDAGLHAYLREAGKPFDHQFTSMCPVSLRKDGDTSLGTRVSAMFVRLGQPGASTPERLGQVVEEVAVGKKELGAMSTDTAMTYAVAVIALAGLGSSTRLDRVGRPACNLVISNVPGVKETRYLNGATLLGIYPVSALAASIGLNVTLSSYHGQMDFGFVANAAAISDVPALAQHTLTAYEELRVAARRSAAAGAR